MKTIRCLFAAALFACSHFLPAQTPALFGQVRVTGSEVIGANQVPATTLQVIDTGTATPRGITHDQYSTGTNSAQINTRKARGTVAAPTTIVSGDILGRHLFWGYDGTNFIESGNIRYVSSGTVASTRVPGQLEFYTSTDALPSVLTLAATINAAQNLVLVNPLAATSGGTGLASFTVGDIFYANTTTTLAKLTAGTPGFFLQTQGTGAAPIWAAESGTGTGDVSGPGSSTNTAIARFNGTSGKNIQNSQATLDGSGNMGSINSLTAGTTTDLTMAGGSSGASVVLGQGTGGVVTITPATTNDVLVNTAAHASNTVRISAYRIAGTPGLWLNDGGSPSGTNYALSGDGSTNNLNAPSGGQLNLRINNSNVAHVLSTALVVDASADSSSTSTGSLQTLGGLGVAKKAFFGDNVSWVNGSSVAFVRIAGGSSEQFQIGGNSAGITQLTFLVGSGSVASTLTSTVFTVSPTTASTSSSTGALVVAGGGGIGGALWVGGAIVPSQTSGITGTTTNNSVSAGGVGEFVESLVAIGSPQSLSNNTAANVTSINLTAGDWDVTAIGSFTETASTVSARAAGISSTSATLPTDGSEGYCGVQSVVTSETNSISLPRKRLSLSGSATVYLVVKANFSAGTCGGFGELSARRVR